MTVYGNPTQPCMAIQESRDLVDRFSAIARAGLEIGLGDPDVTEGAIEKTRSDVTQKIGGACSAVCAIENRCIMESFGPDDPLIKSVERTELQERELLAKIQLANLRRMVKSLGDTEFLVINWQP